VLPELLDDAGRRSVHPDRRLHSGLPAAAGAGARRAHDAPGQDPGEARLRAATRAARARRAAGGPGQAQGAALMSVEALNRAKELLGAAVLSTHSYRGDDTLVVDPARIAEVMKTLRDDPELFMNFLVDLTAVDYLGREPRFEVVYHLRS